MTERTQSAADMINALIAGVPELPNSQKEASGNKVDLRKFNTRHPDSGRKTTEAKLIERGIQKWVDDHINEEVDVQIVGKDGKAKIVKRARVAVVLGKLYQIGVAGDGNVSALVAWLDRALGKAIQPLSHAFDKDKPLRLEIDI